MKQNDLDFRMIRQMFDIRIGNQTWGQFPSQMKKYHLNLKHHNHVTKTVVDASSRDLQY